MGRWTGVGLPSDLMGMVPSLSEQAGLWLEQATAAKGLHLSRTQVW